MPNAGEIYSVAYPLTVHTNARCGVHGQSSRIGIKWSVLTLTFGNTTSRSISKSCVSGIVSKVWDLWALLGPSLMPTSASATRMLSKSLPNWLAVGADTTVEVLVTFIGDVGGAWAANNIDSLVARDSQSLVRHSSNVREGTTKVLRVMMLKQVPDKW